MTVMKEWTQEHGDRYRQHYDALTFKDKQWIMDRILAKYLQVVDDPVYLFACLESLNRRNLNVLELGGYDGQQALKALEQYPEAGWTNCDISKVAQYFTKPELKDKNYTFILLEKPFPSGLSLSGFDLFYTSKMLEHLRWREAEELFDATKYIPLQVHVIDYFWKDDTHVLEKESYSKVIPALRNRGYRLVNKVGDESRLNLFMAHRAVKRKQGVGEAEKSVLV